MSEALVMLGLILLLAIIVLMVVAGLAVRRESMRRQIAHEQAQAEARLQMYTAAAMRRMYEVARQAQSDQRR